MKGSERVSGLVPAFIVFVLGLALLAVLAALFTERRVSAFAVSHSCAAVSDAPEGGNSEASLSCSDSLAALEFKLRSGAEVPQAGVAFWLVSPGDVALEKFFDFTEFDSLHIVLRTSRSPRVTLRLAVHDPRYTRVETLSTIRPLDVLVASARQFSEATIPLSMLKVPRLWFDKMGIDVPDGYRFLDRGVMLEVLSAHGAMLGIQDEIEVASLELIGKKMWLVYALFTALAVWILLFGFIFWSKLSKLSDAQTAAAAKAKELLETSDMNLHEISYKAGFKNVRELRRAFKRVYNVKAENWRTHG